MALDRTRSCPMAGTGKYAVLPALIPEMGRKF